MRRAAVGFSLKVVGYLGTLAAAAALWGIVIGPATNYGIDAAQNTTGVSEMATGAGHVQTAADWSPLFVLGILFLGFVAAAVYESERGF